MTAPGPYTCPCGIVHELTPHTRTAYEDITAGLPYAVLVSVNDRAWQVPRIFIAAHGLKAAELPELAQRYGWEEGRAVLG